MEVSKYEWCTQTLHDQFVSGGFSQIDNLSKLERDSWWENKEECMGQLGNPTDIKGILEERKITEKEFLVELPGNEASQWSGNSEKMWRDRFMASIQQISIGNIDSNELLSTLWNVGMWILYVYVGLILCGILKRVMNNLLRYMYAFLNTRRLIFLKLLLPRWDAKSDREQEKEIAKDMKEKIWRMSQVLWNLHKMNEVSVHEKIMQTFFGKQRLIFIYQYEQWQISCIVWTYPEYQDMVESAIASQYSSASIERVARPKFFKKKYSDIQVFETQRDSLYTIKLYKNI